MMRAEAAAAAGVLGLACFVLAVVLLRKAGRELGHCDHGPARRFDWTGP